MNISAVLAAYIIDATAGELAGMVADIDTYLVRIHEVAEERDFVDADLADRIAGALKALVAEAGDYTGRERNLLAGAIRYFIHSDDANDDLASPTGFEDDAQILNAVCKHLAANHLCIDVA
jgi:dihydropteroate synthase